MAFNNSVMLNMNYKENSLKQLKNFLIEKSWFCLLANPKLFLDNLYYLLVNPQLLLDNFYCLLANPKQFSDNLNCLLANPTWFLDYLYCNTIYNFF